MCWHVLNAFSSDAALGIFCAISVMAVFAEKNVRFKDKKNVSVDENTDILMLS